MSGIDRPFWSYPFHPRVIENWAAYSMACGGPEIAAKFRKNLTDPEGAREAAGIRAKRPENHKPAEK